MAYAAEGAEGWHVVFARHVFGLVGVPLDLGLLVKHRPQQMSSNRNTVISCQEPLCAQSSQRLQPLTQQIHKCTQSQAWSASIDRSSRYDALWRRPFLLFLSSFTSVPTYM